MMATTLRRWLRRCCRRPLSTDVDHEDNVNEESEENRDDNGDEDDVSEFERASDYADASDNLRNDLVDLTCELTTMSKSSPRGSSRRRRSLRNLVLTSSLSNKTESNSAKVARKESESNFKDNSNMSKDEARRRMLSWRKTTRLRKSSIKLRNM